MSELISNASIPVNASKAAADAGWTVGGFYLDLTVFVIGSILMILAGYLIFIKVFGQPVEVANEAARGGSIIQHFNTPKSAIMKVAKVSGGAFQYKDIRDGTVAARPESVININGRQLVFTFAHLGITLSPRLLAGISILVHTGINNLEELHAKYFTWTTPTTTIKDEISQEEHEVPIGRPYWNLKNNGELISGYNFDNFKDLLKQSTEEQFIPLTIESVPAFINKNINASYTEKKLTISKELATFGNHSSGAWQFMGIAIGIALLILVSTVIK